MASSHTPTPWRVEEGTTLIWGNCTVYDDGTPDHLGVPIVQCRQSCDWNARLTTDVAEANAALIVTAVNAYEANTGRLSELEAEVARLRSALGKFTKARLLKGVDGCDGWALSILADAYQEARATLEAQS